MHNVSLKSCLISDLTLIHVFFRARSHKARIVEVVVGTIKTFLNQNKAPPNDVLLVSPDRTLIDAYARELNRNTWFDDDPSIFSLILLLSADFNYKTHFRFLLALRDYLWESNQTAYILEFKHMLWWIFDGIYYFIANNLYISRWWTINLLNGKFIVVGGTRFGHWNVKFHTNLLSGCGFVRLLANSIISSLLGWVN